MLEKINQIDQKWLLFLNGLGSEPWDNFWIILTNKWTSIPLYLILLILSFYYKKTKQTLWILIFVTLMITFTDQMANAFKYGFERLRPCHNPLINNQLRFFHCGGKFGYFSAHAGNSFAIAIFFGLLLRKYIPFIPYFLCGWAMIVSYSRIYLGVHYPLDILTGILLGSISGYGFYKLFQQFNLQKIKINETSYKIDS